MIKLVLLVVALFVCTEAKVMSEPLSMDLFMQNGIGLKLKSYPYMLQGLAIMAMKKIKVKTMEKIRAAGGV